MSSLGVAAREIVEWARLAPSVHNTQPWVWQVEDDCAWLCADRTRQLAVEDPLGRNLAISCGAALHHFWYVAGALGWAARVQRQPEGMHSDLLAKIWLRRSQQGPDSQKGLHVLGQRCTDRQGFSSWPVPRELAERLCGEAAKWGCQARIVQDLVTRFRVEVLAGQAELVQAADLAASGEQQQWIGRAGPDGIPLATLPRRTDRWDRWGLYRRGEAEGMDLLGAGTGRLLVLGRQDDGFTAWLRVGEGLSALWLLATQMGISVVPLSQPLEVNSVRAAVRHVSARGELTPHLMVRVGWPARGRGELPRTPRRSVSDVLRA